MAYSDAQREATERYNRKTYERIELKVKKGQKDYIQKAAASVGKSVNRFILDLVAKETGNDEIRSSCPVYGCGPNLRRALA